MNGQKVNRKEGVTMDTKLLMDDQLYKPETTAEILDCSINFLAKDRMKKTPIIPFVKLSPKFVRYRGSVLKSIMSDFHAA